MTEKISNERSKTTGKLGSKLLSKCTKHPLWLFGLIDIAKIDIRDIYANWDAREIKRINTNNKLQLNNAKSYTLNTQIDKLIYLLLHFTTNGVSSSNGKYGLLVIEARACLLNLP